MKPVWAFVAGVTLSAVAGLAIAVAGLAIAAAWGVWQVLQ